MINIPDNKQLILFDGVCNLCNGSVQFIIRNDKKHTFLFAPLQGNTAKEIINTYNIDTSITDSILLYSKKYGLSTKSTAALKISRQLRMPVNFLVVFFVIPKFIRNWIYDLIARNRYDWFGRKNECMIPTKELRSKFLE